MMTNTLQKYPIIAYSERKSFTNIATSSHSSFNLCTLHVSVMKEDKKRYKLKDHVAKVIKPQVLYVYCRFVETVLLRSQHILWSDKFRKFLFSKVTKLQCCFFQSCTFLVCSLGNCGSLIITNMWIQSCDQHQ